MNTKNYLVSVGNPNCIIDKPTLIKRARKVGVTENQIEELSLTELSRLVNMKESKEVE